MRFKKQGVLFGLSLSLLLSAAAFGQVGGTGTLAQRIGHYDPAKVRRSTAVHDGAGGMQFGPILGANSLSTNLLFLHRGIIEPHSGIGQHFHNYCEEMFVILDGPDAQFTINGRTSVLKTPAGAPDRRGSSHAIYNPSDKPIQWLNINVGMSKTYDAFNMGDDRVGAPLDKIPQFVNMQLDRALLRPAPAWLNAKGAVTFRRALDPTVFFTPWSFVDHVLIPTGGSMAPALPPTMSEAYYVMSGAGSVTVNGETQPIKAGDAIPVDLGQSQSFSQSGAAPLELLVIGIAKDLASKDAYITASMGPRR
jgi:mannose-6-phosphate isomerase-like protein (cupin superfamily)